jgi:hypothetical protein
MLRYELVTNEETKDITLNLFGLHTKSITLFTLTPDAPLEFALSIIVAYMNEQVKVAEMHLDLLDNLLSASLLNGHPNLETVQNKVAKLLSYPDLDRYIQEKLGYNPKQDVV